MAGLPASPLEMALLASPLNSTLVKENSPEEMAPSDVSLPPKLYRRVISCNETFQIKYFVLS